MNKSPEAFRTISEAAEILQTPAHVLRFWESKFTQLKPVKRAGGRRYYRPADLLLVSGIRTLLHDNGMTIRGVQRMLQEKGTRHVADYASDRTRTMLGDDPLELEAETIPDAGVIEGAEAADAPQVLSGDAPRAPGPVDDEPSVPEHFEAEPVEAQAVEAGPAQVPEPAPGPAMQDDPVAGVEAAADGAGPELVPDADEQDDDAPETLPPEAAPVSAQEAMAPHPPETPPGSADTRTAEVSAADAQADEPHPENAEVSAEPLDAPEPVALEATAPEGDRKPVPAPARKTTRIVRPTPDPAVAPADSSDTESVPDDAIIEAARLAERLRHRPRSSMAAVRKGKARALAGRMDQLLNRMAQVSGAPRW